MFACRGLTNERDMKTGYVILYHFLHTDAKEISQCNHAIKYVLHHDGTQCTYCKYLRPLAAIFCFILMAHIILQRLLVCFAVQVQDMRQFPVLVFSQDRM